MSENLDQKKARIAFVQSLISHRIVPTAFAKDIYNRICSILHLPYSSSAYSVMLDEASKGLAMLDLEFRTLKDQSSGISMMTIVNTKADNLIRGATRYSAVEIAFIRRVVEEIFRAKREAYSMTSMEAVRLGGKLRSTLTRDGAEELLKNLVDHRWLDYSEDGIYTLSTRTLLELRNYLQDEYEDHYHACTHCKDLTTLGIGCWYASRGCSVRYHHHCARATIAAKVDSDDALQRLAGFSCVGCGRSWKSRAIGPRALRLGDDGGVGSSQGTLRDSGRRDVSHEEVEQDEEAEEEEERYATASEEEDQRPIKRPLTPNPTDDPSPPPERHCTPRVKPELLTPQQTRRRPAHESEEHIDVKPRKRTR